MRKVTKRDLHQNTASVLGQVTEMDDIVVTECGEPKWRISAYRHRDGVLTGLEREGHYTPSGGQPDSLAPPAWRAKILGRKN